MLVAVFKNFGSGACMGTSKLQKSMFLKLEAPRSLILNG